MLCHPPCACGGRSFEGDYEQSHSHLQQLAANNRGGSRHCSLHLPSWHPLPSFSRRITVNPPTDEVRENEPSRTKGNFQFFRHQVSGHAPILDLGNGRIAKPVSGSEAEFYSAIVDADKRQLNSFESFIPQYFGHTHIDHKQIGDMLNPLQVKSFLRPRLNFRTPDYIVLEDLTAGWTNPSILDLKMGTRQYGLDATGDKIKRQIAKCEATTSASLGVRMCGMQVYDSNAKCLRFYDKYFGRTLDETGFENIVRGFFSSQPSIAPKVLERLQCLRGIMLSQSQYHFYGSSLWVAYDSPEDDSTPPRVGVKIIDFTHVSSEASTPDEGFIKGLETLIAILEPLASS